LSRDRILVIDDDRDLRATVELRFSVAGFEVLQAGTGEEGIKLARSGRPLAIILDVNMPGIDGFETCRRLRADPKTASIPVIMLTTCSRVGELEEGLQAGADTYLTKPFDGPELVGEVMEIVASRLGRKGSAKPPPSPRAQAATRIKEILERAPRRVGQVARVAPGMLLGGPHDDRLLADSALSDRHRSILFEADIEPFAARPPAKYLRYSPGVAMAMSPDPTIFDAPKKVLLRRTAPPLVAALDEDRRLADKAVICVAPRDGTVRAEFLLGVLASSWATFAFEKVIARSRGGALPWASAAEIERLPLPGGPGPAGRDTEAAIAAAAAELVGRARQGQAWLNSAGDLRRELDYQVGRGFGAEPELIEIVSRP